MELVSARLRNNVNQPAAIVPIFSVKIVREDPKFRNRIEIGNHGRTVEFSFFDRSPVDHESVGLFTLATDGEVSGI